MVATRGAVYASRATAGAEGARRSFKSRKSAGRDNARFHDYDRCRVTAEADYDPDTEPSITPEDADRVIVFNHPGYGRYVYDTRGNELSGRVSISDPPAMPRQPRVEASRKVQFGALTPERLASVDRQIATYEGLLPDATATQRDWMTKQLADLRAERATIVAALGQ